MMPSRSKLRSIATGGRYFIAWSGASSAATFPQRPSSCRRATPRKSSRSRHSYGLKLPERRDGPRSRGATACQRSASLSFARTASTWPRSMLVAVASCGTGSMTGLLLVLGAVGCPLDLGAGPLDGAGDRRYRGVVKQQAQDRGDSVMGTVEQVLALP